MMPLPAQPVPGSQFIWFYLLCFKQTDRANGKVIINLSFAQPHTVASIIRFVLQFLSQTNCGDCFCICTVWGIRSTETPSGTQSVLHFHENELWFTSWSKELKLNAASSTCQRHRGAVSGLAWLSTKKTTASVFCSNGRDPSLTLKENNDFTSKFLDTTAYLKKPFVVSEGASRSLILAQVSLEHRLGLNTTSIKKKKICGMNECEDLCLSSLLEKSSSRLH